MNTVTFDNNDITQLVIYICPECNKHSIQYPISVSYPSILCEHGTHVNVMEPYRLVPIN